MTPALRATQVTEALQSATGALAAAGCDTPRLDAEVLLAHVLGTDRARLLLDARAPLSVEAVRPYQDAVRRRAIEREPVAYIIGRRGFRHIELAVDPRVLIPRPETELLVEIGLELPPGQRVLDVGTGSGAVALALKQERPDLDVSASDASGEALAVARANAVRLGLEVELLEAELLAPALERRFDAVLANPPYVPDAELARLAPEIVRHEPAAALRGGPDGLDVIRALVAQAGAAAGLALLAIEVGAGQAPAVETLLRDAGFGDVGLRRDLAGVARVAVAER